MKEELEIKSDTHAVRSNDLLDFAAEFCEAVQRAKHAPPKPTTTCIMCFIHRSEPQRILCKECAAKIIECRERKEL